LQPVRGNPTVRFRRIRSITSFLIRVARACQSCKGRSAGAEKCRGAYGSAGSCEAWSCGAVATAYDAEKVVLVNSLRRKLKLAKGFVGGCGACIPDSKASKDANAREGSRSIGLVMEANHRKRTCTLSLSSSHSSSLAAASSLRLDALLTIFPNEEFADDTLPGAPIIFTVRFRLLPFGCGHCYGILVRQGRHATWFDGRRFSLCWLRPGLRSPFLNVELEFVGLFILGADLEYSSCAEATAVLLGFSRRVAGRITYSCYSGVFLGDLDFV